MTIFGVSAALHGDPIAVQREGNRLVFFGGETKRPEYPSACWHLNTPAMARAIQHAIVKELAIRAAPPSNIETSRPLSDVLGSPVFDHLTVKMGWSVEDGGAALVALDIVDAKGGHQDVPAWLWDHVQDVYHHDAEESAEPLRWPVARAESPEEIIDRGIAAIAGEVAATRRAADVARLREAAE